MTGSRSLFPAISGFYRGALWLGKKTLMRKGHMASLSFCADTLMTVLRPEAADRPRAACRPCPMPHPFVRRPPAYSAASTRVLSAEYSSALRKARFGIPQGICPLSAAINSEMWMPFQHATRDFGIRKGREKPFYERPMGKPLHGADGIKSGHTSADGSVAEIFSEQSPLTMFFSPWSLKWQKWQSEVEIQRADSFFIPYFYTLSLFLSDENS